MMTTRRVRQPSVAGMFYPSEKGTLSKEIDRLLAAASGVGSCPGTIAIIAPHAGYQYSGPTAAHAYRCVERLSFETIVIVSPSHREYFDGISVYDGDAYAT